LSETLYALLKKLPLLLTQQKLQREFCCPADNTLLNRKMDVASSPILSVGQKNKLQLARYAMGS